MMHLSDWHWLCATDPHREHLAFLWLREDRGENRVYAEAVLASARRWGG